MRRRLTIVLGSGAAALALGIGTTTAMAATTWTVKPGGSVTGKSAKTVLTDKNTGVALTCVSSPTLPASKAVGSLKSGSGLANPIGKLTSVTFNNCTGPAGLTFSVKTSASKTNPWPINATSFSSSTGTATGNISHIHATLTGTNISCSATVDGTGATANNGKVTIKHSNGSPAKLKVTGAGNLHVYNVMGACVGAINSGDATSFVATYTLSTAQKITSP
jgi:hypothetical protein